MRGRHARIWAIALSGGLLVSVFAAPWSVTTSEEDTRCEAAVDALVNEVQARVGRLETMTALEFLREGDATGLVPAIQRRSEELAALGCEPEAVQELLVGEVERLTGEGTIAAAVASNLRSAMLGLPSGGPREIAVSVHDDLVGLAVTAPAGSTLVLAAGEHHTDEPLVVHQDLAIVGAGRDETRIVSTADEVAVLALDRGSLELSGVTVAHDAEVTAAVVQIASEAFVLRGVRITGGRAAADESGGVGLLIEPSRMGPAAAPDSGEDGHGQVIEDVEVSDNEGGGVLVTGTAAPTIRAAEVRGNGRCGVCYAGTGGGVLRDSLVTQNEVGIAISGRARPRILRNRLLRNGDHGVVVTDAAAPRLTGNRFEGHAEAAVVVGGEARAVVADNDLTDQDVGVWVEGRAAPTIERNDVSGPGTVGIVFTGGSSGEVVGNRIAGLALGIDVREQAVPRLSENVVTSMDEAAILLRDESRIEGVGNRCEDSRFGVVLLDQSASNLAGDGCRLHDQR